MVSRKPRQAPLYSGELAKPIPQRRLGLLEDHGEEQKRIAQAQLGKLPSLAQAHGITTFDFSPAAMSALALALARAHVPGFRVSAPAGRPKTNSGHLEAADLLRDVRAVTEQGQTLPEAIAQVRGSAKWRDVLRGRTTQAVNQQLKGADVWLQILEDAEAWRGLQTGRGEHEPGS